MLNGARGEGFSRSFLVPVNDVIVTRDAAYFTDSFQLVL
jgi:hypothetical protein